MLRTNTRPGRDARGTIDRVRRLAAVVGASATVVAWVVLATPTAAQAQDCYTAFGYTSLADPAYSYNRIKSGQRNTVWEEGYGLLGGVFDFTITSVETVPEGSYDYYAGFYWGASQGRWMIGSRGYTRFTDSTANGYVLLSDVKNGTSVLVGTKRHTRNKVWMNCV